MHDSRFKYPHIAPVNCRLYKVHARNFKLAIYDESFGCFVGIRSKFTERYLDNEFPHTPIGGTVKILEYTGKAFSYPLTRESGPFNRLIHYKELFQFLEENQETC